MGFQISGLKREQFRDVLAFDDDALAAQGAKRFVADTQSGFPCRVSLIDAAPGERVILLTFKHQPARSPYHGAGPIFVRETQRILRWSRIKSRSCSEQGYFR